MNDMPEQCLDKIQQLPFDPSQTRPGAWFAKVFLLIYILCLLLILAIGFAIQSGSPGTLISPKGSLLILLDSLLLTGIFIEIATPKIGLPGGGHAQTKRLLALLALGIAILFARFGIPALLTYGMASLIALVALLDALSEPLSERFPRRRSLMEWIFSVFFAPGWISATWLSLLIFVISAKALYWERVTRDPQLALIFASFFAAIIWPAALIRLLLSPKSRRFLPLYFLFQVVGTILAFIVHWVLPKVSDVLMSLFPSAVFFLSITAILPPTAPGLDIYLWISTILCCFSLFLLFARAILLKLEQR